MIDKKISKLTFLTCLLVSGIVNAKKFYTCIPRQNWLKNTCNLMNLEEKLKIAKTQIDNDSVWELVEKNKTSGILSQGIYKVVVKGGDGGNSGYSSNGGKGGDGWISKASFSKSENIEGVVCSEGGKGSTVSNTAGNGGVGKVVKEVFMITTNGTRYEAAFGRKGENGTDGEGGEGGNGGIGDYHKTDENKCPTANFSSSNLRRQVNNTIPVFEYKFISYYIPPLKRPKKDKEIDLKARLCEDTKNWKGVGGGGGGGGGAATGGQGGSGAGGYFKVDSIEIEVCGGIGGGFSPAEAGESGKGRNNDGSLGTDDNDLCSGINGEKSWLDYTTTYDITAVLVGKANVSVPYGGCGKKSGKKGNDGLSGKGKSGGRAGRAYCVQQTSSIFNCKDNGIAGEAGKPGKGGKGGDGGQLMNSDDVSNEGDGYVRIYRYKG